MIRSPHFTLALALSAVVAACTTTAAPSPSPSPDGDAVVVQRTAQPCVPGEVTLPIGAFDMTSSEGGGRACAVGNVLDEDGKFAAIASAGSATHELAGRAVNGCIGVEFGDDILLSSFIMKMRPTHGACGHSCTPGVETGCGTGWKVAIFVGPTLEELEFLQQLSLTTEDVFEYRVAVFKSNRARYAVICREPTPETGDDVEIDALAGFCQVQ